MLGAFGPRSMLNICGVYQSRSDLTGLIHVIERPRDLGRGSRRPPFGERLDESSGWLAPELPILSLGANPPLGGPTEDQMPFELRNPT